MSNVKIGMALCKEINKNIMIEDADKKYKYFCFDCDEKLIVRKGKINAHHYSHKSKSDCGGETCQHKYCKALISDFFHNIVFCIFCDNCKSLEEIQFEKYEYKSSIEYKFDTYFIDVALINENKMKCAIEIYHTHKTTDEKYNDIIKDNCKFIEICTSVILFDANNIKNNICKLKCENNKCNKCTDKNGNIIVKQKRLHDLYYGSIFIRNKFNDKYKCKIDENINKQFMSDRIRFLKNEIKLYNENDIHNIDYINDIIESYNKVYMIEINKKNIEEAYLNIYYAAILSIKLMMIQCGNINKENKSTWNTCINGWGGWDGGKYIVHGCNKNKLKSFMKKFNLVNPVTIVDNLG